MTGQEDTSPPLAASGESLPPADSVAGGSCWAYERAGKFSWQGQLFRGLGTLCLSCGVTLFLLEANSGAALPLALGFMPAGLLALVGAGGGGCEEAGGRGLAGRLAGSRSQASSVALGSVLGLRRGVTDGFPLHGMQRRGVVFRRQVGPNFPANRAGAAAGEVAGLQGNVGACLIRQAASNMVVQQVRLLGKTMSKEQLLQGTKESTEAG